VVKRFDENPNVTETVNGKSCDVIAEDDTLVIRDGIVVQEKRPVTAKIVICGAVHYEVIGVRRKLQRLTDAA
jgi:hypothetical protein